MTSVHLTLPYPPSVNQYWRRVGNKTLVSAAGRKFQSDVSDRLFVDGIKTGFGEAHLAAVITVSPPDRRRHDIDNLLKATFDALQKAGLYADDSQIVQLYIEKREPVENGRFTISLFAVPTVGKQHASVSDAIELMLGMNQVAS